MNREIFAKKKAELFGRKDFCSQMISTGLADLEFVLVGMTIDHEVMVSEGKGCFVANGYPPSEITFRERNSGLCVKYVISATYRVVRNGDKVELVYICEDVDVLYQKRVAAIFSRLMDEYGYTSADKTELRKAGEDLVWEQWGQNKEERIVMRCYVDSGRFQIIKESSGAQDFTSSGILEFEVIKSRYSAYRLANDEITLMRDEWTRKTSGIGVFIS